MRIRPASVVVAVLVLGSCSLRTPSSSEATGPSRVAHAAALGVEPSFDPAGAVFADEFDGTGSPDPTRWEPTVERRHASYQTARPENLRVEGGNLVIEARHESYRGEAFTSAMVKSRSSFTSGRFAARMKLPAGAGTWPAFWLLGPGPWPDTGEIDVLEHYAQRGTGDNTYGWAETNLHSTPPPDRPDDTARGRLGRTRLDPTRWHVYAVDWRADEIRFSIDGRVTAVHRRPAGDPAAWPFDRHPEVIVFDLFLGSWAGPVDASAMPQRLLVDWVRVWPLPAD